jgi:Tol biopolymer transport system component
MAGSPSARLAYGRGSYLALPHHREARWWRHGCGLQVVQASSSGGDTVPIPTSLSNIALDNISPDNSELLVGSFTGEEQEQTLWALPVLGGTARRLSDVAAVDGTWTPSGDLLISHQNQLWIISKDSSTLRKFSDPGEFSWWLRWSPDGKRLRFTRNEKASSGDDQWDVAPFELQGDGGYLHPSGHSNEARGTD